jgi:hypothetical protein
LLDKTKQQFQNEVKLECLFRFMHGGDIIHTNMLV